MTKTALSPHHLPVPLELIGVGDGRGSEIDAGAPDGATEGASDGPGETDGAKGGEFVGGGDLEGGMSGGVVGVTGMLMLRPAVFIIWDQYALSSSRIPLPSKIFSRLSLKSTNKPSLSPRNMFAGM